MSHPTDLSTMTGLEVVRALAAVTDERPSIARLMGITIHTVDSGEVTGSVTPQPDFANALGTVHGGICATLLDAVMGCAVHTMLAPGVGYTTLELKVNYLRTVSTDAGPLTATGSVIHAGRTTATAEGRVHDDKGHLVAHATTTCLILS
ncbi:MULTISPECIES: PaaI family thioesterase [Nocardia]|uniref:PaaI family thioesterase n=1 Tax=Nocardia TaxID=1817 RepID=UPI0015EEC6C1|nr:MULTISPECIES: PaaI family thioesterase [Nocardia]MCA2206898.1 PaaI family thioesterase [Nocardia rosealba]